MPMSSSIPFTPIPWKRPSPPAGYSPSWRIPRWRRRLLSMARAGRNALSAFPPARAHLLVREVMLGAILGGGGGWAAAQFAIWLGL